MRIAHLLPGLDVGGVETHVVDLASEQARSGHQVTVISGGGRMVSRLSRDVTHITMPVDRKNPFIGGLCALRLVRLARRRKWDVLHAHSRVPAWIAWWTSILSGVPFVVTCHSIYSLNAGLTPYRHADGAVCVSESVMDHQKDWLSGLVQVIRNGIPAPEMEWSSQRREGTPFRFLFVGRLTKVKGADFLISLFSSLSDRYDWVLEVAGEGSLERSLRAEADAAGLNGRVDFLGYRKDVTNLLARCDCCLFPSRSEGAGLVLLSALAMGVPVLASDIPAFGEILPRKNLLPMEIGPWETAILSLLSGGSIHKTPRSFYSLSEMAIDLENIYSKVIDRERG